MFKQDFYPHFTNLLLQVPFSFLKCTAHNLQILWAFLFPSCHYTKPHMLYFLNHLAVLFAALLYSWCFHVTGCSEIAVILLDAFSITTICPSQQWALISPQHEGQAVFLENDRVWRAMAVICWLFQTTWGRGATPYKMTTAIVGICLLWILAKWSRH